MSNINTSNYHYTLFSFTKILVTSLGHVAFSNIKNVATSVFGKGLIIFNSESAWHQNLSLMQGAQSKTNDTKLKNRIRFLAVNYLNKIAPLMPSVARVMGWNFFESAFQISPYSPYQYHRAFFRYRPDISSSINQRFALGDKSPLVLTDTDQFDHFLPLKFIVLNRQNRNEWNALILKGMQTDTEVLFDFTQDFGNTILTERDKEKENTFCIHFNQIKNEIDALIHSMKEAKSLREFLKQKSTSISRVKFECNGEWIGGMKILPLFSDLSPKNVVKTHPTLAHYFIEQTGIVLGAIRLRRLVPEAFPLPNRSARSTDHFSKTSFENKEDFIKAIDFKKIEENSHHPHVAVLGKSFLDMLKGLMSKINLSNWNELNQNPATREILQTVLDKIIRHLRHAEASIENNNAFIQAIELAHAELATLLELTTPYQSKDFQSIYLKQLKIIPKTLLPFLKGGLSKTAETVFAELNVAVKALNPKPVYAWSNGFYFEHALLLGQHQKLELAMKEANIDNIDLYGCTFNPSIEAEHQDSAYVQNNLIADIEKILKEKSKTQHLTVAIDFTNDYFNSAKSQSLLEHFESDIHSGRLNFVFFSSGQKFDMLGMDHFYGSPFYMINNGADHWKPFDKLFTANVHQTDSLSTQWFCLLYEFASKSIDEFRHLFLQNNRNVLQNVPENLFSKERKISVSKVDEKTDLTFIDVKIRGIFNKIIASLLVSYFQFHAIVCKVKASVRGSFGFLHPNVTLIFAAQSTTLRLHSGILESDNQPIIKFLHHIA